MPQPQPDHDRIGCADPHHLLVIGVGPGIGAAVARRFSREGFRLTLVARRPEALAELATQLRSDGASVAVVQGDAADPEALRSLIVTLANGAGAPGVVVYNAALMESDGLLTSSVERFEHAHAVNVVGAIATAQAVVPAMRAAGAGTLLYTGGGLADSPEPALATLSLGKVALRAMTTMLATELFEENIHVASVTVNGRVAPGTAFDPDDIADFYWEIHSQPRQQWRSEHRFDGR